MRSRFAVAKKKRKEKRKGREQLSHLAKLRLRLGAVPEKDSAGREERARPAAGTPCGEGGGAAAQREKRKVLNIMFSAQFESGGRTVLSFVGTTKEARVGSLVHAPSRRCARRGEDGEDERDVFAITA